MDVQQVRGEAESEHEADADESRAEAAVTSSSGAVPASAAWRRSANA